MKGLLLSSMFAAVGFPTLVSLGRDLHIPLDGVTLLQSRAACSGRAEMVRERMDIVDGRIPALL